MAMSAPFAAVILALLALLATVLPASAAEAPADVTLALQVGKEAVYPGQKVPLAVTLQVIGSAPRNVGYPSVPVKGLRLAPFGQPQQSQIKVDSAEITAYRFDTSMTAFTPGRHEVGPATLECEILASAQGQAAFFGEVAPRKVAVSSPAAAVTVLPFPAAGRPASFSGGIGEQALSVVAKPEKVQVGDPVTVTTTTLADGTLPNDCPAVAGEGWRSHPPRVLDRGRRLICEQVLIPARAGSQPFAELTYFDPAVRSYRTVKKTMSRLTVLPVKPQAVAAPAPASRRAAPAPTPAPLPSAPILVTALCAIAAGSLLFKMPRRRRDIPPPQRLHAATANIEKEVAAAELAARQEDAEQCYRCIRSALQEVVAPFVSAPPAAISYVPMEAGVAKGAEIGALFTRCDSVRYGRLAPSRAEMERDLKNLRTLLADIPQPL
jgi:hypothetical protein